MKQRDKELMSLVCCRCSAELCKAYQYKGTGPGNCLLIQNKCAENDNETFIAGEQTTIYDKGFFILFLLHTYDCYILLTCGKTVCIIMLNLLHTLG